MALRFSKVKYGGLKGRLSDLQVSLKVFVHHMSNEPLSKIGYLLGWWHCLFHLNGLIRPVRSANRELQNENVLPSVGFEPGTFHLRNEVSKRCAITDEISIEQLIIKFVMRLPDFVFFLIYMYHVPRGRRSKMFCHVLNFIKSLHAENVLLVN